MPTQHYYFSRDPSTPSPPQNELLSVEAESPRAAIAKLTPLIAEPRDWHELWVHVLVWTGRDGNQRGFESVRLKARQD